ncbi:MAG: ABC transporter permease [Candidatus Methylomirabilales bacterium]
MRLSLPARIAALLIALPPLGIVIWLFFIPFLSSAHLSLLREDQWSFRNYYLVWRLYRYDILYTLWIAVVSLAAVLAIAVFLCGYLRLYANRPVEFLFKIPLFIPFVVVGHAMRVLLAPKGTLNAVLSQVGMIDMADPPSIAFGWIGIAVSLIWKNLALAVLLVLGAYRSVDETFLEAARNFGASAFRQIRDVLLPMSRASIAVASAFMFTSMLASFSVPLMIGSGEPPQMVMIDVYYRINYQGDYGTANALGVVSYLMAMAVAGYYLRTISQKGA